MKIRGGIGSILVCAIESENSYDVITWASAIVDGEKIKEYTWYTVKEGKFVEWEDQP